MAEEQPAAPTMDALKVQRRQQKAAITRHLRDLECGLAEEDMDWVKVRLDKLRVSFRNLEDAHSAYHDKLVDDADIDHSDKWMDEINVRYNEGIKSARDWLVSVGAITPVTKIDSKTSSTASDSASVNAIDMINAMAMPKIELDVFSGDPLNYQMFIAVFDECVDAKVVDDQQKLTRLLQYTAGPAKAAIRNCVLIGGSDGYHQAREILKSRFGGNHLVAQKVINDLKTGKPVYKPSELQQLGDDLTMALTLLESMAMLDEIGGQQCIIDILNRCPQHVRNKWKSHALEYKHSKSLYPKFNDFVKFVNRAACDWNDPIYGYQSNKPATPKSYSNLASSESPRADDPRPFDKCPLCSGPHKLLNCDDFKSLHPRARFQLAKDKRLCFNCLVYNHVASSCRQSSVCSIDGCGKKHSKFLHFESFSGNSTRVARNDQPQGNDRAQSNSTMSSACTSAFGMRVHMPIVPICVNGKTVLALMDTGGSNTMVSERLAKALRLRGPSHTYYMNTVNDSGPQTSPVVSLNVSSVDGIFTDKLTNVLVRKGPLPARYPDKMIDVKQYAHLADISFPEIECGDYVDLIIGEDNGHLLFPLDARRNEHAIHEPHAIKYVFGWCLNGKIDDSLSTFVQSNFVQTHATSDNLWQLDNHDFDVDAYSVDDRKVIELWDREVSRVDGHYVLPIPWKDGRPNLPNNKFVAKNRLIGLQKRLARDNMTDVYDTKITEMLDRGYAEPVPADELGICDGSVYYLPHHPVVSASKPGKVRPVFDCAAQFQGISLNNQCYQGPDMINKLVSVLLRFRQYRYALMADVEAMYLQVRVPDIDRNALRFLWFKNGDMVEYRMTSHLFGGVWCAASSTYALRRTVVDVQPEESIKDTVLRSFYVDDALRSCKSVDEAVSIIGGTKSVLKYGGFNLTKFTVNDREIMQNIDIEERAAEVKDLIPNTVSKALGIKWDVYEDKFIYVNKVSATTLVTRRTMLSAVASMYDPLGLVSPIIVHGKMLFQEATKLQLSWDDPVPESLRCRWLSWLSSLDAIKDLKIDRCVLPPGFENGSIDLHNFGDASTQAYGACTYLRAINMEGRIHVALLVAKGRLAPVKPVTVPRLELQAAVLAVNMDHMVRRDLDVRIDKSYFWTDSQIVMSYIHNTSRRFKVFVANRVAAIHAGSNPSQWGHIHGKDNPADIVSRGCVVGDLPETWFNGPSFLWQYKSEWPTIDIGFRMSNDDDPEVLRDVKQCVSAAVNVTAADERRHPVSLFIEHYSSLYRIKKGLAWLMRFISYLKDRKVIKGPVTCSELGVAEHVILRHVQSEAFPQELHMLQSGKQVKASSSILKLSPRVQNGLIVVGGRLTHATVAQSVQSPIILPHSHKVSLMLVRECHYDTHAGTEWLMSYLRRKYWITKARSIIKRVSRQCVTCRRLYASPASQKMADLPPERCRPYGPAFKAVGVDLFGPFSVKVGRATAKRYGCVFSCFTSRAVHIEKLDGLDTDAYINGFVRFSCRRGYPDIVTSDNGTNFVGAQNELKCSFKDLDRASVVSHARRHDVTWRFNPPMASHMGGVWERMIRTIRRVLYALLSKNVRLTDDILSTVFCEAENMVNSRPITKVSDDPKDDGALTPNHLLLMHGNYSYPWTVSDRGDTLRKQWRHAQLVADHFWKRWLREFLPMLNERQKWHDKRPNMKIGDLVLVVDELAPRGSWPLGLVVGVNVGRDNLVRSARVKIKAKYMTRPITKLVLLEGIQK